MALRHGVIKAVLGADRIAISVIELTVCTVNVDVPDCLNVLVGADPTTLSPGAI